MPFHHNSTPWCLVLKMSRLAALSMLVSFATSAGTLQDGVPQLVVETGNSNPASALAFGRRDQVIVTGARDGPVLFWDSATAQEIKAIPSDGYKALTAFLDDRRVISVNLHGTAELYDVESSSVLSTFTIFKFNSDRQKLPPNRRSLGDKIWNRPATLSDNKRLLAGGNEDGTITLYDASTGREKQTLPSSGAISESLSFDASARHLASLNTNHLVTIYDVDSGTATCTYSNTIAHNIAFRPDGKLVLSVETKGVLKFIDSKTCDAKAMDVHIELRAVAAFSHNSRYAAVVDERPTTGMGALTPSNNVEIIDTTTWNVKTLSGRDDYYAVGFSDDDRTLAAAGYGLTTWSLPGLEQEKVTSRALPYTDTVAFDGEMLEFPFVDKELHKSAVVHWNLYTGEEPKVIPEPTGRRYLYFGSPVKLVAAGDQILEVTDNSKLPVATLPKNMRLFHGNASADGKRLATVGLQSDKTETAIWNLDTGKEDCALPKSASVRNLGVFDLDGRELLTVLSDGTISAWDTTTCSPRDASALGVFKDVVALAISPDDKTLAILDETGLVTIAVRQTGNTLSTFHADQGEFGSVSFGGKKGLKLLLYGTKGRMSLWNLGNLTAPLEIAKLFYMIGDRWAVVDSKGRFDASQAAQLDAINWVSGLEVVGLGQLKRYYEPQLLSRLLGGIQEPLRDPKPLDLRQPVPLVRMSLDSKDSNIALVEAIVRSGAVGKAALFLNNKQLDSVVARPLVQTLSRVVLRVDLSTLHNAVPGETNVLSAIFENDAGVRSKRQSLPYRARAGTNSTGQLWGVVAGISVYAGGEKMQLTFPAKDAKSMYDAVSMAGANLLGKDNVHLRLLVSGANSADAEPSRSALEDAFKSLQQSRPQDVVIVYLAGHGTGSSDTGEYYYYTNNATGFDLASTEDQRRLTTISSGEIRDWMLEAHANKQVLILDTCGSGIVVDSLGRARGESAEMIKALERLSGATGLFVLAGASHAKDTYEHNRFGQGLLTYSLLFGMQSGEAEYGDQVDVLKWFGYALNRVPELAEGIFKQQTPRASIPEGGATFPIGLLSPADRAKVPVSKIPLAIIQEATFGGERDFADSVQLGAAVNKELFGRTAFGASAPFVYVDSRSVPGAFSLTGRYTVSGHVITVKVQVYDGAQKVVQRFTLKGDTVHISELAKQLVDSIDKDVLRVTN
jgi:WD40 repeat protein